MKYFPGMENNKQSDTVTGRNFYLKTKINERYEYYYRSCKATLKVEQ